MDRLLVVSVAVIVWFNVREAREKAVERARDRKLGDSIWDD